MMVDNLNQINNNFSNPKENIYKGLIDEFETHLLPENKKLAMIDYLKNNCEMNFSKDVIMILEDYNSIISQAIQAIRSLLSENEKISNKNINYEYSNYYNKNNPSINVKNDNNCYNFNYNNSNSNFNSIYNNKNNTNYNNYNNYNFNYGINNTNNNDMNINNNLNNTNNINYENNYENNYLNNDNNNYNYNYNEPILNYDYLKNKDITSNEPLKKPIREQLKTLSKENSKNNLLNMSNPNKINLNNYNNNGKNSFRMAITGQIPNITNSQNYSFNNNGINSNINNNNNNLSIYNSNTQTYEDPTNFNMNDSKKREMEKLKVTNKILKLIEIANQKKNYFVEKYVNSSSLNYENDYKEFLDRIINYKFDILTLNQILNDLNDFYLINPRNKSNKKKENYSYSKEKIKNQAIENQSITESNEAFKKNLRKYSYPSLKKPPFVNATNPYGHLFS